MAVLISPMNSAHGSLFSHGQLSGSTLISLLPCSDKSTITRSSAERTIVTLRLRQWLATGSTARLLCVYMCVLAQPLLDSVHLLPQGHRRIRRQPALSR